MRAPSSPCSEKKDCRLRRRPKKNACRRQAFFLLAAFADLPYGNKAASAKHGFCIRIRQVRELLYRLPRWGSWRVAPDEGLRKAKHRTMLCRLPACPHPSPFGDTFPKGEGLDVVPPASRRMAPFYLCLPCVKGVWYGTRCVPNEFPLRETSRAPEGLLQSKKQPLSHLSVTAPLAQGSRGAAFYSSILSRLLACMDIRMMISANLLSSMGKPLLTHSLSSSSAPFTQ